MTEKPDVTNAELDRAVRAVLTFDLTPAEKAAFDRLTEEGRLIIPFRRVPPKAAT